MVEFSMYRTGKPNDQFLNCSATFPLLFLGGETQKSREWFWKALMFPIMRTPARLWVPEYSQLFLQRPGDQLDNAVSLRPSEPGTIWGEGDTPGFTARLPIKLVGAPGLEFSQQQRFLWDRRQHASNKHPRFLGEWGARLPNHLSDSDTGKPLSLLGKRWHYGFWEGVVI